MRDCTYTPRLAVLVISTLGFGLASCSFVDASNPNFAQSGYNRAYAAPYAPAYTAQHQASRTYVLQAQNTAAPTPPPGLRGLSTTPYTNTPQFYRDYSSETPSGVPVNHGFRDTVLKNRLAYQLDDSIAVRNAPIISQPAANPPLAQTYIPRVQNAPIYDGPIANPPRQPDQLTNGPIYDGPIVNRPRPDAIKFDRNILPEDNRGDLRFSRDTSVLAGAPPTSIQPSALSINDSLNRAVGQSPRLAIEDLRIQEAEEGLVQAKAQSKFKLDLESVVGATQSETDFRVVDTDESDFRVRRSANLNLSLPLYQGGRLTAQRNVAKTGIDTARANYETVESAVSQETAIAHLNVIRDRRLIEIYRLNVDLLKQQQSTVRELVEAGENTLTDQALLDARLATLESRLEQARANLDSSESNYKKLVGREAPSLMEVNSVPLPGSLQEVKELARKNNSQIRANQTLSEEAKHNIAVAKSFGRPKLALQGVLRGAEGRSETIRRDTAAEILLNLTVPILSGGENKSRVRQAALAQSRALLETRQLHDDLNERIEQLWADVQSARRSQAPNQLQKTASQKAYDAIVLQRDAGLATALDVLTVQQNLFDAEINLVEAQNAEDVSRFQLLGLMGAI